MRLAHRIGRPLTALDIASAIVTGGVAAAAPASALNQAYSASCTSGQTLVTLAVGETATITTTPDTGCDRISTAAASSAYFSVHQAQPTTTAVTAGTTVGLTASTSYTFVVTALAPTGAATLNDRSVRIGGLAPHDFVVMVTPAGTSSATTGTPITATATTSAISGGSTTAILACMKYIGNVIADDGDAAVRNDWSKLVKDSLAANDDIRATDKLNATITEYLAGEANSNARSEESGRAKKRRAMKHAKLETIQFYVKSDADLALTLPAVANILCEKDGQWEAS